MQVNQMAAFGKVVLITGGAGGIGLAITKELFRNGAKAVAIVDISESHGANAIQEIETLFGPNKAIFIKTDITKNTELENAYEKTVQTFNQLDIVFNNAGAVDENNWEFSLNVNLIGNLRSTYLALHKYLQKYKSGEEGVIVNTASVTGLDSNISLPTYSAAKHSLISLGKTLGLDPYYKLYKVRILTVCPGPVNTPLLGPDLNSKIVFPELFPETVLQFKFIETPETAAKNFVQVLNEGKTGSVWVSANNEPVYEIAFSDRKYLRL